MRKQNIALPSAGKRGFQGGEVTGSEVAQGHTQ